MPDDLAFLEDIILKRIENNRDQYGTYNCTYCRNLNYSHSDWTGIPPDIEEGDTLWVCVCSNRWWQYNRENRYLWKHIIDPEEWQELRDHPGTNEVCEKAVCEGIVNNMMEEV